VYVAVLARVNVMRGSSAPGVMKSNDNDGAPTAAQALPFQPNMATP
jgi:hypothetical protein